MFYPRIILAIVSQKKRYGDTLQLMSQLEEVSKLLEAYTASILNSGF